MTAAVAVQPDATEEEERNVVPVPTCLELALLPSAVEHLIPAARDSETGTADQAK